MKVYLKFLVKFTAVICLTFCLLSLFNKLYINGKTYKGTYTGIEKFEDVPENITFANFGPSYGMNCFQYDEFERNGVCFNFSLTMQDFYHDYALYKKYENNFAKGAIIAIPVSYFSFCSATDNNSSTRYYKLLESDFIKGYTLDKYISCNYIPVYGQGSSLLRDCTTDYLNSIMNDAINDDAEASVDENKLSKALDLHEDSKTRVMTIENGYLKSNVKYIEQNKNILMKWIEEMKERGFTPILVLTPYYYEYAYGFDEKLLDNGYNQPLNDVIEKTNVLYLNFNSEKYHNYINTTEYFSNCDHVSSAGAREFMELYTQYLIEKGFLE